MASSLLSRSLDQVKVQDQKSNVPTGPQRRNGGGTGAREGSERRSPYARPSAGNGGEGAWAHDMYASDGRTSNYSGGREEKSCKLQITNLHYEVLERELEALFSQIGPIVAGPKIKFDRSGRSQGIAWVTYGDEEHAAKAKEAFNGAPAKGQNISIRYSYHLDSKFERGSAAPGTLLARLDDDEPRSRSNRQEENRTRNRHLPPSHISTSSSSKPGSHSSPSSSSFGARGSRGGGGGGEVSRGGPAFARGGRGGGGGGRGGGRGRGGRGGGGGGGDGREPRGAPKSQEQLDSELEAFMATPSSITPTTGKDVAKDKPIPSSGGGTEAAAATTIPETSVAATGSEDVEMS